MKIYPEIFQGNDFSCMVPVQRFNKKSEQVYLFEPDYIHALTAAYHAGRPLLVRGDPGTGKSQLARAAAQALDWQFVSTVITAHTEIQDLWYHFDTVNRLGQAQLMGAMYSHISSDKNRELKFKEALSPEKFLSPGVLWWAYDWKSALKHSCTSIHRQFVPEALYNKVSSLTVDTVCDLDRKIREPEGVVLLIDEIDKADSDLPNSLLETLDQKCFDVPWVECSIGQKEQGVQPLVIITTNEERQLPPAFLRRCLVLNMNLPVDKSELKALLIERGKAHFGDSVHKDVMAEAADQLIRDRDDSRNYGYKPPGQAEYLDILRVLHSFDISEQERILKNIQGYALRKHPETSADTYG